MSLPALTYSAGGFVEAAYESPAFNPYDATRVCRGDRRSGLERGRTRAADAPVPGGDAKGRAGRGKLYLLEGGLDDPLARVRRDIGELR